MEPQEAQCERLLTVQVAASKVINWNSYSSCEYVDSMWSCSVAMHLPCTRSDVLRVPILQVFVPCISESSLCVCTLCVLVTQSVRPP
jgi:hypothetical protein